MNKQVKQIIRQQMRKKRALLSLTEQVHAGRSICHKLLFHPLIKKHQHIALYYAIDGEIMTRPLIEALWKARKHVYLPLIHPFSVGHLLFQRYTTESRLVDNAGLQEPELNVLHLYPITGLDIIIVPMVAFDKQGYRLGMGGGYYDRLLKNYTQTKYHPIGIAHDCQQIASVPREEWDIKLPEVITPKQHIKTDVLD